MSAKSNEKANAASSSTHFGNKIENYADFEAGK
jgi:hypothetical protein